MCEYFYRICSQNWNCRIPGVQILIFEDFSQTTMKSIYTSTKTMGKFLIAHMLSHTKKYQSFSFCPADGQTNGIPCFKSNFSNH